MLRKEREICYKHRDAYYEALSSSSSSSNTTSNNKRELKQLKKLFEKHCPSSWVEHFEKIRLDSEKFASLTKEEEEEEEKSWVKKTYIELTCLTNIVDEEDDAMRTVATEVGAITTTTTTTTGDLIGGGPGLLREKNSDETWA